MKDLLCNNNNNNNSISRIKSNFLRNKHGLHPAAKYAQIVWADTYQIGCARAIFQQSKGSDLSYREHFICNYGPAGNIPNQPVYEIGPPCSRCDEGTGCTLDYPALCSGKYCLKYKNLNLKLFFF